MNKNEADVLSKHLKLQKQLFTQLKKQYAPVLEAQKTLKKSFTPVIKQHKSIQSKIEPLLKEHEKLNQIIANIKLPNFTPPDISLFQKQIEQYQKAISVALNPAYKGLQRSFDNLPPKIQDALLLLAQHGWYLDLNMPLPKLWKLKKIIEEGQLSEAESALVQYFENELEEIGKFITLSFPNRAHIISSAVEAHLRGDYYLSIPVFLAQTDGICKEVIDQYLFMKNNKKPRTAIYVEQFAADTFKAAFLSPLATTTPIGASERERKEDFNLLNRHMVLHGESLDYGTKVNSLKALSLINYVSQVLKDDS